MILVPLVVSNSVRESPLEVHFPSDFVHVFSAFISHLFEHSSQVLIYVTVLCAIVSRRLPPVKVSFSSLGHFLLNLKIEISSAVFTTIDLV